MNDGPEKPGVMIPIAPDAREPEVEFLFSPERRTTTLLLDGKRVAGWYRELTEEEKQLLRKHKGNFHAAMAEEKASRWIFEETEGEEEDHA